MNTSERSNQACHQCYVAQARGAWFVSPLLKCAASLALLTVAQTTQGAVVFTERFDDLSAWTVVDADGAGTGAAIVTTGGNLHVTNDLNTTPTQHGLYAGQVAPAANARVYYWGVAASGSRPVEHASNAGGGPVGTFNLSNADGVRNGFVPGTPVGAYIRNRLDVGPDVYQTEAMRIINNDNIDPHFVMAEGVAYDLRIDYSATHAEHWYKLSSDNTWQNIGSSTAITLSGLGMYLNIDAWGGGNSPVGEGANWLMNQIDITDSAHAILTAPVPVPEPGTLLLAVCGCVGLVAVRRRRIASRNL